MDHIDTQLEKARNWLRLLFHSVVCAAGPSCSLGPRCFEAKQVLGQLVSGTPAANSAALASIKDLVHHYLACQAPSCGICVAVWADLSLPASSGQPDPAAEPDQPRLSAPHVAQPPAPPAADPEAVGDAYTAAELLHYLLYCLLAHDPPSHSHPAVRLGRTIWHEMLTGHPPSSRHSTAATGRLLIQHRVACQLGTSCAVCSRGLLFFARSSTHQQQQHPPPQLPLLGRRPHPSPASSRSESLALQAELDSLLDNVGSQLSNLQI